MNLYGKNESLFNILMTFLFIKQYIFLAYVIDLASISFHLKNGKLMFFMSFFLSKMLFQLQNTVIEESTCPQTPILGFTPRSPPPITPVYWVISRKVMVDPQALQSLLWDIVDRGKDFNDIVSENQTNIANVKRVIMFPQ